MEHEFVRCFVFHRKMGVTKLVCDGYDDLVKRIGGLSGQKVFILFTGNKLPETGKSWCPDCVAGLSVESIML